MNVQNWEGFFEDLSSFQRAIRSMRVSADLSNAIINRNYKGVVQELLRGGDNEANKLIMCPAFTMTGLEYAIYHEDVKLAALFFYFGADPKNNGFDGTIQTMASDAGYGSPAIMAGFDGENLIPGFDGLNMLIDEDGHRCKAYVWIMRALYQDGTFSVLQNLPELINNLEIISQELEFSGNDCKDLMKTILICMRKMELPYEIRIRIVEETVLGTLWMLIQRHGLKGCEEE